MAKIWWRWPENARTGLHLRSRIARRGPYSPLVHIWLRVVRGLGLGGVGRATLRLAINIAAAV